MILVFDPRGDRLYDLLASTFTSRAVVQKWADLYRLAPAAECCVLLLRWLDDRSVPQGLEAYRRGFPDHPTVLVVERSPANLLHLTRLPAWEVVWMTEVERTLPGAVRRATATTPADGSLTWPGGGRGSRPGPSFATTFRAQHG